MDKAKQLQSSSNEQPQVVTSKRLKATQDEILAGIEIKHSERGYLDSVFERLCTLQNEASSDEDSKEKIYKKNIDKKANEKKMKVPKSTFVSKTSQLAQKSKKTFQEDEAFAQSGKQNHNDEENEGGYKGKFGIKALRKVLRTLCEEYPKEEMELMIWEVDENLDGYISKDEFEKMYKRCITDEKEQEPKKLFYLIQFLMYDKEINKSITVEDTLEILCVRHGSKMDDAIDAIFDIEVKDEKGNIKKTGEKMEKLTYLQYAERMHSLSLRKRFKIMNKKQLFCEKIKMEAIAIKK